MASNAFQMESNLLAEARDHDELLFDDAYEAATDNEESDMSEFSSNNGADDRDAQKFDGDAVDLAVCDCDEVAADVPGPNATATNADDGDAEKFGDANAHWVNPLPPRDLILLLLMVMLLRRLRKQSVVRKCRNNSTVATVSKTHWEKGQELTLKSMSSAELLHFFVRMKNFQPFNGKCGTSQMSKRYWSTKVNWTIGRKVWKKWREWFWSRLQKASPVAIEECCTNNTMLFCINDFRHAVHIICPCMHACSTTKPSGWHSLIIIFYHVASSKSSESNTTLFWAKHNARHSFLQQTGTLD